MKHALLIFAGIFKNELTADYITVTLFNMMIKKLKPYELIKHTA